VGSETFKSRLGGWSTFEMSIGRERAELGSTEDEFNGLHILAETTSNKGIH
jgi:hypothetical protein